MGKKTYAAWVSNRIEDLLVLLVFLALTGALSIALLKPDLPLRAYAMFYLAANGLGVALMFCDKTCSQLCDRKMSCRLSERSFCAICLLGGGLGVFVAVNAFQHKSRKTDFQRSIALCCMSHVAVAALCALVRWHT
ncbi:unnamed protein product [Vitrella brassicaformis CCMP3155]|uniref:DUF1294 domain-containing protein n=1 Tax=Vitrella brassicaformis (strain CCMP3155) TaxID=1169540 RepID=A0A0G4GG66_VITBC|nr:unnamed protein product [Vitrella brassicaformis CCMP3155]|eukprot:CEM28360.1 unnamed protein product [Vitrella brassicaformis CCMP3155]